MTPKIKAIWTSESLYKKFFSRLRHKRNGCIEYTGNLNADGYGYVCINAFFWRVHRLIWTLACGEIEEKKLICHKCDNPCCVNLSHLFIGSYLDNNRDSRKKGRGRKQNGENNTSAKLTETQVKRIRWLYDGGHAQADLARQYKVDQSNISRIVNLKKWKKIQNKKSSAE